MHYHLFVLSVLTLLPFAGLATPLASPWEDVSVKHAWKTVPDNWESLGPPHSNSTTDIYIALKPENENALIDALYEVSTPGNPKYGAHLSKEEVAELVAPHPNTLELVHSWLAHHEVQSSSISTTHGGNWLTLTGMPVLQANKLLGASYQLYRYAGTNDTAILRTIDYSLPTVLHEHVQTVAPTTVFASPRMLQQTPQMHPVGEVGVPEKVALREVLSSRGHGRIEPDDLRWLYKTEAYVPKAITKNKLGVAGYKNEFPSFTDLERFMIALRSDAVDATFEVKEINGSEFDPDMPGYEANLNMQYAQAMAYPTPHIFYSIGGKNLASDTDRRPMANDCDVVWLSYLLELEDGDIPQTISISYGGNETIFPREYAVPICDLYAKLGARGVSILSASGDYGVGGPGDCKDENDRVQFIPTFPASCPYITSVGGTTGILPEVGVDISGGGFSNIFPQPDFQKVSVPAFLTSLGTKNKGLYNATGRGIPDVSAQALKYVVSYHTNPVFMSGTSASTPTVAGIISLLNDFLISEGEPPLGWLNPWLYGTGQDGLNDITSGSNRGCGGEYGFSAVEGWDPVTGLGTLDFFELMHVLFATRILPKIQGRAFSGLLNTSDAAAVSNRDASN